MEYKVIADKHELLAEEEEWRCLYSKMESSTPFQSWEWYLSWLECNREDCSPFVIKAFIGREAFGYAPLVERGGVIEFAGARDIDYGRFIVGAREREVIIGFLDALLTCGKSFSLQEMAAENEQLHIVKNALKRQRRVIVRETTRTVYVGLERYEDFEQYLSSLSPKMRKELARRWRRVRDDGITVAVEEAASANLLDVKRVFESRQEVRGGSASIDWALPLIGAMCAKDCADLVFARKDGKPLAFTVVLKDKRALYTWLAAIDGSSGGYGLGQLLKYFVIERVFAEGYKFCDFMRGDYDYKLRWDVLLNTNYTVDYSVSTLCYLKSSAYYAIRPVLRNIVYNHKVIKELYLRHYA